ncbi:MAG: hypothetical protein ACUVQN_06625 [Caldisericia bacterium]
MKIIKLSLFVLILYSINLYSQEKIESDIENTFVNAKKGVYWALSNLGGKKAKFEKLLIADDKLISKVKVSKELNGVRIESTGYNNTNEVTIVIYRSADSLIKDGYIKKGDLETYLEED